MTTPTEKRETQHEHAQPSNSITQTSDNKGMNMNQKRAHAELHYTGFEDAETFQALLNRHDLLCSDSFTYERKIGRGDKDDIVFKSGWHIWCGGNGLHLLTKCNPLTGVHLDEDVDEKEVGYASFTRVIGPEDSAEDLFWDVIETATYVKGEFLPLTAEDGKLIAGINDRYHGYSKEEFEIPKKWRCSRRDGKRLNSTNGNSIIREAETKQAVLIPAKDNKDDFERPQENCKTKSTEEPLTYEVTEKTGKRISGQEITRWELRATKTIFEMTEKEKEFNAKVERIYDVPDNAEPGDIVTIDDLPWREIFRRRTHTY